MPTRKKNLKNGRFKIGKPEKSELILLSLPLLCLGLVLVAAVLTNNAASSKAPSAQAPTPSPVSAARVTPTATTSAIVPTPTTTTVAQTNASDLPATVSSTPATANVATTDPTTSSTTPPTTPAQTVRPGSPAGTGIRLSKTEGGLKFDMLVSPGHIGDNSYDLTLSENGNLAVSDARLVRLSVSSLDMEMGVARLDLNPAGPDQPGLYSGEDKKLQMLSMFGKYKVEVLVQRPGKSDVTTTFELSVTTS